MAVKFLYLRLTNFLSYKDLELDLTNIAYTSVTGPNGSGKSTIPAAIPWILYGSVRVSGDRDSIVNDESTSAEGYLDIQDNDGVTWQIGRGREYNGSGWVRIFQWDSELDDWVQFGDHLNATHQSQIDKIVGISEDAFYSLVLMQSSGGTRFTSADSNTRRSILHGLVPELNLWSSYHSTASERLTDSRREIGSLDQTIESLNGHINEEQDRDAALREQIGSDTQDKIDADSTKVQSAIDRLTKRIGAVSGSDIDEINARIEAAQSKHQLEVSDIRQAIDDYEDDLHDRERAESDVDKTKKRVEELEDERQRLQAERKETKSALKGYRVDVEELKSKLDRQEPKLDKLKASSNRAKNRLADIREQIEGLELAVEKNSGVCPVCSSALSTKKCHSLLDDLQAEKSDTTAKLDDDIAAMKTLTNKISDAKLLLGETESRLQRGESRIESIAERVDAIDKSLDSADAEMEKAEKTLESMPTKKEILGKIDKRKSKMVKIKEDYEDNVLAILEKELETAKSDDRGTQMQIELDELKSEQKKLHERAQNLARLSGSLSTVTDSIASLTKQRKTAVSRQTELNDQITDLAWLDRALSQKGIPAMLLDSVLGSIEFEQNQILEQLSDADQMRVEFRQSRELKSREGTKDVLDIVIHTAGGRERAIESFSSGQRVRLAISNIFAMIKVFNERNGGIVKTLFLDEPLGVLDERSVPAFIEVLRVAMNSGIVESIWVITHDRTVIDALPQQVQVSLDESKASIVTVT